MRQLLSKFIETSISMRKSYHSLIDLMLDQSSYSGTRLIILKNDHCLVIRLLNWHCGAQHFAPGRRCLTGDICFMHLVRSQSFDQEAYTNLLLHHTFCISIKICIIGDLSRSLVRVKSSMREKLMNGGHSLDIVVCQKSLMP